MRYLHKPLVFLAGTRSPSGSPIIESSFSFFFSFRMWNVVFLLHHRLLDWTTPSTRCLATHCHLMYRRGIYRRLQMMTRSLLSTRFVAPAPRINLPFFVKGQMMSMKWWRSSWQHVCIWPLFLRCVYYACAAHSVCKVKTILMFNHKRAPTNLQIQDNVKEGVIYPAFALDISNKMTQLVNNIHLKCIWKNKCQYIRGANVV